MVQNERFGRLHAVRMQEEPHTSKTLTQCHALQIVSKLIQPSGLYIDMMRSLLSSDAAPAWPFPSKTDGRCSLPDCWSWHARGSRYLLRPSSSPAMSLGLAISCQNADGLAWDLNGHIQIVLLPVAGWVHCVGSRTYEKHLTLHGGALVQEPCV